MSCFIIWVSIYLQYYRNVDPGVALILHVIIDLTIISPPMWTEFCCYLVFPSSEYPLAAWIYLTVPSWVLCCWQRMYPPTKFYSGVSLFLWGLRGDWMEHWSLKCLRLKCKQETVRTSGSIMTLMCLGAHASDPQLLIVERCVHWRKGQEVCHIKIISQLC